MIAWQSLVFFFLLPGLDLAARLLGLPPALVWCVDAAAVAALSFWAPRLLGLRARITREWPFLIAACIAVGAGWYLFRVTGLSFSPFGENMYDLHYIASLLHDDQLPAADLWNPGAVVERYYYFGFYIVAFYSRLLGLDAGQGYALFMLLIPILCFANFWAMFPERPVMRVGAAFVATFPATGISALIASGALRIEDHLRGMAHVRIAEWTNTVPDGSPFASAINGYAYPIEGLAHVLGNLGDLHPPVFTLTLLAIVLASLFRAGERATDNAAPLICGLSLPLAYVINPWALPCFCAVAGYALLSRRNWRFTWIAGCGALAGSLLTIPLLASLKLQTGSVSLALVPEATRAPPLLLIIVWGPLLVATAALAASRARRLDWLALLTFIAMVVGLEVILLDDMYGDRYERFNSVVKISSIALVGWTAMVLREALLDQRRWIAPLFIAGLAVLSIIQLWDSIAPSARRAAVARNWALQPVNMLPDADQRALFSSLSEACRGTVLERQTERAYSRTPMVSTLLGWPTYGGWPFHLSQIGAFGNAEETRHAVLQHWFSAPETALLSTYGVDYVLIEPALGWSQSHLAGVIEKLAPDYRFVGLNGTSEPVLGYFVSGDACNDAAPPT